MSWFLTDDVLSGKSESDSTPPSPSGSNPAPGLPGLAFPAAVRSGLLRHGLPTSNIPTCRMTLFKYIFNIIKL